MVLPDVERHQNRQMDRSSAIALILNSIFCQNSDFDEQMIRVLPRAALDFSTSSRVELEKCSKNLTISKPQTLFAFEESLKPS